MPPPDKPDTSTASEIIEALIRAKKADEQAAQSSSGEQPGSHFAKMLERIVRSPAKDYGRTFQRSPGPNRGFIGRPLDPSERDVIEAWANKYWRGDVPCQICRHNDWVLLDRLVQVPATTAGIASGSRVYPMAAFMCQTCGNTVFINAVKIGLVPPPPENVD